MSGTPPQSSRVDSGSFAEELRYAELLVRTGLCPRDRVDAGLKELRKRIVEGATPRPTLSEVLVERGDLSPVQVQSTILPAAAALTPSPSLPPDVQAAAAVEANRVGKYVKVSLLGSGGMGEVWKAWDGELRRWVALKFLRAESSDQLGRFRREAQMAAGIHHPNIAAVYEVGEAAGRPYIAMQFVPGRPLNAVDNLTPRLLAKLIREAALAIHAAHEQGTIHRDIKPENLMVVDEGANRKAYVLDFGLARPTGGNSSLSVTGTVVGTPAFMSPEQARADAPRVGPATDIYGLGATLYDGLARRPPFVGKDPLDILRRVVDEDPTPLRTIAPGVDRDLETIVMTCLAKEPERRYASARALADDLGRWLAGDPIQSRRAGVSYRVSQFLSRRKPIVAAAALGSAALVLALVILLVRERSLTSTAAGREQFMRELGAVSSDIARTREWIRQPYRRPSEIRDEMLRSLRSLDALVEAHPRLVQGWVVRAKGRLILMDLPGAESDLRMALRLDSGFAPAWSLLGRVQLEQQLLLQPQLKYSTGDPDRGRIAGLQAEIEDALHRGAADDAPPERWGLPRSPEDEVHELLLRGLRLAILEKNPQAAADLVRRRHEKSPSEEYARFIGLWTENPGWVDEALRIAPHYVAGLLDRAMGRVLARDWTGAQSDYTSALDLQPEIASAWGNRGRARMELGDRVGAKGDFDNSVRLAPESASVRFSRAQARETNNEIMGALADYDKAIDLHPGFMAAIVARAELRLRMGDALGARTGLDRAMARIPNRAPLLLERARVSNQQKDPLSEMADYDEALRLDPKNAEAWVARGLAWVARKDFDQAIGDFSKAILVNPNLAQAWRNRAKCYFVIADLHHAEEDFTRVIELEPTSHLDYSSRANVRISLGNRAGAAADFDKVIQFKPK